MGEGTQSSIVTIFCMWNAMMGASMLTMPWAIHQAGFASGMVLLILMTCMMGYTSYRIVASHQNLPEVSVSDDSAAEFSDIVRIYLGRFAETATLLCSVVIFLGVSIVYWIVMSSSLYHIVIFLYEGGHDDSAPETSSHGYHDAVCQSSRLNHTGLPESFKSAWSETKTVPLFLVIPVFPLICIKSPTFFIKFTASGVLFVAYLAIFVCVKTPAWGLHLSFADSTATDFTHNFRSSFPSLTGVATMAFFIHSSIMTYMRLQKHPENNTRDIIIANALACATYIFIGGVFYASFPLEKDCVKDNLLDNMTSTDIMSFIGRVGLFFQLSCILPLLIFLLRTQLMKFIFNEAWPGLKHVVVLNVLVVATCVLFASFLPQIGRIISFVGAFGGLSYGIVLPCLVFVISSHQQGTLTITKLVLHCLIVVLGVANFMAQFIVIGEAAL